MSDKSKFPLLLVVCTGNVCRSPMAEALFSYQIMKRGLGANVISRGLAAPVGRPPHQYVVEIARKHGVYIDPEKRAEAISSAEIATSTVVFVMDSMHRREVQRRFPTAAGKTFLLGQWQGEEIADPINQPIEAFERAWTQCFNGVNEWVSKLCESGLLRAAIS